MLLLLFFVRCSNLPEQTDSRLISDLPSAKDLADSLNATRANTIKWMVEGDEIVYGAQVEPDWKKELEVLIHNDVNHLRFRDAFSVSDSTLGAERTVRFRAKSSAQEIQLVKLIVKKGRLIYYLLEKSRSNLYSSNESRFEFKSNSYTLSTYQRIAGLFEAEQFVYGSIIPTGKIWRGAIQMQGAEMPFQFIYKTSPEPIFIIKNGDEMVPFHLSETRNDSLFFTSATFNSSFVFKQISDSALDGYWLNAKTDSPYRLPFHADAGIPWRFNCERSTFINLSGTYQAILLDAEGGEPEQVQLKLTQTKHLISGTFLSETGDYRYLEGVIKNDSLFLSAMDGSHAYLFTAAINKDELSGVFQSGLSHRQTWSAKRTNESLFLQNHTKQVPLGKPFDFVFSDSTGSPIQLSNSTFAGKPCLISISASWCSNCLDEAVFLNELYESYRSKGLEVILISFEVVADSLTAWKNVNRFARGTNLKFDVLLGGLNSTKQSVSAALPTLNPITAYPTLIALNQSHQIVDVHSGFNGPATGLIYDQFKRDYYRLCDTLVMK